MNRVMEMELMRLLHGELPPDQERALRGRLEREPGLAAALARLQKTWSGLELPPAAPVPLGFAQRVAARAREQSATVSWSAAPGWVRAAAAAALAFGILLGAGASRWTGLAEPAPEVQAQAGQVAATTSEPTDALLDDSLAASYWSALDDIDESGEAPSAGETGGDAL